MKARSHRRALAAVVAVLLPLGFAPVASAAPEVLSNPKARIHFERAQGHFDEQDYAAAIPELKAAYAVEPNPMLLYAWAQAERLAGSCSRAVELYRRFLATGPGDEQRRLTEANLVDCEAEVPAATTIPGDESTELEPARDDAAEDADDASDGVEEQSSDRHWIADPVGGVLTGAGLVVVIAGGAMMGVARQRGDLALQEPIEGDYLDQRDSAIQLNTAGIVTLGIGSALVLGGVIRYAVKAAKGRSRAEPRETAWVTPVFTGTGLGLGGRF
ncbi:MAG: hypothetical protein K0V04_12340 [Deltaproteobacteria bacterium]|nr:hypothetical protein [Deltaproteobacteria bacterium]